jgi:hypothetical protein
MKEERKEEQSRIENGMKEEMKEEQSGIENEMKEERNVGRERAIYNM